MQSIIYILTIQQRSQKRTEGTGACQICQTKAAILARQIPQDLEMPVGS